MKVVPVASLELDKVQTYWQTLYMHDLLRFRLCDVKDPTWSDVVELIRTQGQLMFNILDGADYVIGEFAIDMMVGKAARVHFSMHPEISREDKIEAAKFALKTVFTEWTSKDKSPYALTLFGLTPVTNKAAQRFNKAAGFARVAVLPNGAYDRGDIVDAVLFVITNGEHNGDSDRPAEDI